MFVMGGSRACQWVASSAMSWWILSATVARTSSRATLYDDIDPKSPGPAGRARRRERPQSGIRRNVQGPTIGDVLKLATWNVNSLAVRLPQVLDWLALHQPDALCLQETKTIDDKFPHAEILAAGSMDRKPTTASPC
jgi:Endonuclease/Exonuclease/phosphatase family